MPGARTDKVLVVEDDLGIRALVTMALEDEGFQVEEARAASHAAVSYRGSARSTRRLSALSHCSEAQSWRWTNACSAATLWKRRRRR